MLPLATIFYSLSSHEEKCICDECVLCTECCVAGDYSWSNRGMSRKSKYIADSKTKVAIFSWQNSSEAMSEATSPNTMEKIIVCDSEAVVWINTPWGTRGIAYHQRLLRTNWNVVETIDNSITCCNRDAFFSTIGAMQGLLITECNTKTTITVFETHGPCVSRHYPAIKCYRVLKFWR